MEREEFMAKCQEMVNKFGARVILSVYERTVRMANHIFDFGKDESVTTDILCDDIGDMYIGLMCMQIMLHADPDKIENRIVAQLAS